MLEYYSQQHAGQRCCWKCIIETVLCAGDENSDDDDDVDVAMDEEMNGEDAVDSDMSDDDTQAAGHPQDSSTTE